MSTPATPRGSAVSAFVFDLIALLVFAFLARLAHDDGAGFSISRWLDTVPHWSFMLVATVMSALLLFGWRLIARVVASR